MALAIFLAGRSPKEVPDILPHYERFRRERTDVIQAEARKNGLRYDSRSGSLEQRDKEIPSSATLRRWLYDNDIEAAAEAYVREARTAAA